MRTRAPCPNCAKPITLARVMASPTPLHLRCPSCKLPVRAENLTLLVIAIGVALGLLLVRFIFPAGFTTTAVIETVLLVLVAEVVLSLVVLNHGELAVKKPRVPEDPQ